MITVRADNSINVASPSTDASLDESFHTTAGSITQDDVQSKFTIWKDHFKKALQMESFSTSRQSRVLMHCRNGVLVRPVDSIADVNFTDEIHERLKSMKMEDAFRTQQVAWLHLLRGHSLIVINAAKAGKTWTYLPAVCSLLMEEEKKTVNGEGPVMIIICLDSAGVNNVERHCARLHPFEIEALTQYDIGDAQYKMLNGIHILIATVPSLLRLMKSPLRLFNKKRLARIVFDEIDSMCDRFGEKDIHTIYKTFCENAEVQMIVTSKTWHKTLKKFCEKDDLLLCIGGYIEAAIYSDIEITLMSINQNDRYDVFSHTFRQRDYVNEQTVIVCSESEEVLRIQGILQSGGYITTCCHDRTNSDDIGYINEQIRQKSTDRLGVLVCTDDVLGDLTIRNAQHIIHFSLPNSWTTFTQRFIASFDYYENLIEDGLSAGRPSSTVFVDTQSCDSLPRLVEFMRTRCFAKVPKSILKLAEEKRAERENQHLETYKPFCDNILLLGVCHDRYSCTSRHIITKVNRRVDSSEWMPQSGKIKFELQFIHSPAHFTVRLLEHCSLERNEWQKMPNVNDYFSFRTKFDKHLGDLCVIGDENEKFERCKIIGIYFNEQKSQTTTTLTLIDSNVTTTCFKSTDLLVLPEQFKHFPSQAVDIRIAGVVPLDSSTTWDKNLRKIVQKWFEANKHCQMQATIELTIEQLTCIWVKSVEMIQKLSSINEELDVQLMPLNSVKAIQNGENVASTKPAPIPNTTPENRGEPFAGDRIKSIKSMSSLSQLIHPTKLPHIAWRQTETIVTMAISAPDVKDYSLKVGSRYVQFCFVANQERFENVLNLFGCVDVRFTSHEVRGLNIIIRLKKTLAAINWPRLEQSPYRNRFIKCTDECDDDDENFGNDFMLQHRHDIGTDPSVSSSDASDASDVSDLDY